MDRVNLLSQVPRYSNPIRTPHNHMDLRSNDAIHIRFMLSLLFKSSSTETAGQQRFHKSRLESGHTFEDPTDPRPHIGI